MFGMPVVKQMRLCPPPSIIRIRFSSALPTSAKRMPIDPRTGFKSQITLVYDDEGAPTGAHKIVLSTQHAASASQADIRKLVTPVIADILPDGWMVGADDLLVNPTDNFVIGGPDGDAGLTGRKIIGHLWRGSTAWGRRFFWKGSHQGRQISGICSALSCQECCRSQAC